MDRRSFVIGSTAATATTLLPGRGLRAGRRQLSVPRHHIHQSVSTGKDAADVVGRPFAAVLEPIIKQPAVIDTKAGAAGAVGAQVAANAKPDGYTLLLHIVSISGFSEVDKLFGRQPKFTRARFHSDRAVFADPCVLIVNDQTPYHTLRNSPTTPSSGRTRSSSPRPASTVRCTCRWRFT